MVPIRLAELGVEPVSLAEMRLHLRLDPDDLDEDALVERLIAASRAAIEVATRRLLRPARFRVVLNAWPSDGILPLGLSPLVSLNEASLVDAEGVIEELDPALFRLGPDPWEAPCLIVSPQAPLLLGRTVLIEVTAGCGGNGPPAPAPLLQAIRMSVATWFENRGDVPAGSLAPPPEIAGLIGPHRHLRL